METHRHPDHESGAAHPRVSRFMERFTARKGAFTDVSSDGRAVQAAPADVATEAGETSFLQLYMKAFAAARQ